MCVPDNIELKRLIFHEAHKSKLSIHTGSTKMYQDLKKSFQWLGMKRDIAEYVAQCAVCQQVKIKHQKPRGTLQPLEIPMWKWDNISMDFIVGLPRTRGGHDSIWVTVDRSTKSAHFLPVKTTYKVVTLARLFMDEIVQFHGVPFSIVSDRDPKFTSRFWKYFRKEMGTSFSMSTANHLQYDG